MRIGPEDDYPEVRVKIDSAGVYEMPYPELEAKGYPLGVPIAGWAPNIQRNIIAERGPGLPPDPRK